MEHNAFVVQAMKTIGPGLIDQGSKAAQLVAIESLFTGMIAFVAKADGMSHQHAAAYMRAVHHAAQLRLGKIM